MAKVSTVILAAGKGTRMKSDLPKVLHTLNGRPMVDYVIDAAEHTGSEKTVLIVGHMADLVKSTVKDRRVEFALQSPQLGTGHAVMQAESHFAGYTGHILVLSGDVPLLRAESLKKLVKYHDEQGVIATLLTSEMQDPTGYGRIIRGADGSVVEIVEEKDASEAIRRIREINVGIYVFKAEALFKALPLVKNENSQGEYYLPDVLKIFAARGERLAAVLTKDVEETHGINTVEQLKHAEKILGDRPGSKKVQA